MYALSDSDLCTEILARLVLCHVHKEKSIKHAAIKLRCLLTNAFGKHASNSQTNPVALHHIMQIMFSLQLLLTYLPWEVVNMNYTVS